jgi:hypothetical protein
VIYYIINRICGFSLRGKSRSFQVVTVDMAMEASMEGIRGQGKEATGTTTTTIGAGATLARTISCGPNHGVPPPMPPPNHHSQPQAGGQATTTGHGQAHPGSQAPVQGHVIHGYSARHWSQPAGSARHCLQSNHGGSIFDHDGTGIS